MPRTRTFWFIFSIGSEATVLLGWNGITAIPITVVSNALNDHTYLCFSAIWLVFAFIHGYRSYRNLKTILRFWYKEWHIFFGAGDICLLAVFWLIATTPESNSAPDTMRLFLGTVFILSWFLLLVWAAFVVRKYPTA
jgi:hypothetical protein